MYNIIIKNISNKYDYNELIKVFFRPEEFTLYTEEEYTYPELSGLVVDSEDTLIEFNHENFDNKDYIKREVYDGLSQITGLKPPWGILTGVRPVKLTGEIFSKLKSADAVKKRLIDFYLLSDEKAQLLIDTWLYQQEICGVPDENSVGIYIGIPFCPTRCLYCSFTSNQVADQEIERYLEALHKEISFVGRRMRDKHLKCESLYIGGGTPTTLNSIQLDELLSTIEKNIDLVDLKEFTVEAGRPDTITESKLNVLKKHGIRRISINPQTMKNETLRLIGRAHSSEDIINAFTLAKNAGMDIVNADIIAGLPEETPEDFENTLRKVIELGAENITVHTLAVKRASRLVEMDKDYHYRQGKIVAEMLQIAKKMLKENDYKPYYLYRQKHMAGSFENTGYCKGNTPCIYNIRIMEEKQSILALGAGGISKIYFPKENRLERVANVSNYEIYISRLEEMLDRKEKKFFKEV